MFNLNSDEDAMEAEFVKTMNAIADGTPKDIKLPTDDLSFERKSRDLVKLYRVSDESGEVVTTEVGKYPLKRELLESKVLIVKILFHLSDHPNTLSYTRDWCMRL